jgi:hypothetical protein
MGQFILAILVGLGTKWPFLYIDIVHNLAIDVELRLRRLLQLVAPPTVIFGAHYHGLEDVPSTSEHLPTCSKRVKDFTGTVNTAVRDGRKVLLYYWRRPHALCSGP